MRQQARAFHAKIVVYMSVSRSTYRHRLSSEDVRKTRILITKDAWKLFPGPGERVALRIGARRFDAEIKSERCERQRARRGDRKSTRLNSSHDQISYAVFCLKKKKNTYILHRHSSI